MHRISSLHAEGHHADNTLLGQPITARRDFDPTALPFRASDEEKTGGTRDIFGDMKDLASQEAHRYVPLWTDRYPIEKTAHSCNSETYSIEATFDYTEE